MGPRARLAELDDVDEAEAAGEDLVIGLDLACAEVVGSMG